MIQQRTPAAGGLPIGISDIGVFLARRGLSVPDLIAGRSDTGSDLRRRLDRARTVAGQRYVRFPEAWEDAVTLGAEAARRVLARDPRASARGLRLLAVGTETSVDHAKPVAAYVQGLLKAGGHDLGTSLTTLQLQHACAGSTMGLLHVAGRLQGAPRSGQQGLVLSTDIARYRSASTAELTQGAGAVAVLVEHAPRLLTLDLSCVGQYSTDADDFFRPLGQTTAQVRGSYSIKCYRQALAGAIQDYGDQRGRTVRDVLRETDFVVLHTPFRNMPQMAFEWLLERHGLGGNGDGLFTRSLGTCLEAATDQIAYTGNLYNGSLYYVLAHLLANLHAAEGPAMVGKRILLGAYGSGATMLVLQATVARGAPEVIQGWDLPQGSAAVIPADYETFRHWAEQYDDSVLPPAKAPAGSGRFYLKEIRGDGYRLYAVS